nr:PREDICTED: uncharacterized protein LOC108811880 [Raphanus sativus]
MNPASRNLYRASRPTFRLDGTPEIIIPTKVLQLGPENVGEYVIGQFHRCSAPSGGLTHAVVNRLWGRSCKIVCRKLGESSYLFHVPHKETRQWIIQRCVWHVDDCLMFVAPWNQVGSLKLPEISTVPAWVTLKNIPTSCYSRLGISHIASGLGEPMLTHKPRLDPFTIGEAKILVEIELDKNFPKQIALDDKLGNIFLVDVEYSWIPSTCERCGSLEHKAKRCLLKEDKTPPINEKGSEHMEVEIPVVTIDSLLDNAASDVQQVCVTTKVPEESNKANDITSDGLSQHIPFQFGNQGVSSTGVNCSLTTTDSLSLQVAISHKDSSTTFGQSSLDAKFTLSSTLAGNDPSYMTPMSTKSIQEIGNMESNFHITEQMDEFGNMTRGGRLIKPTQKYQEMGWLTVRGRGKRGRRGRGSYQAH